jgi:serine/threonine-protein kinase
MTRPCSNALLEAALAGSLPAAEEATLHQHLEECEECSTAMERMAGGVAWCHEAAALLTGDELDGAVPARDAWSEVDFSVEYLEPAGEPNVLGRLGGYDVLGIIGRGGMGIVLKGFERELKRCVAIKVLAPHLAHSSLAKKRFAREAQAAAAVVHPNVLAIHQVQASGRLPFLVMPLIAGETLAQRLTVQGTLGLKEILRIGMQAAAGLAAAHEQGLVHRDVKPANILLEKGVERAVLTDFGLARAADDVSLTHWGIVAGTPEYMSPEQARGEPLDGRSDLFSLGCVLYEMATGVSPFRTDSMMATMRRLVDDVPQAMGSLNPELPPWFIALVERLLEKDPSRRFASAKEVSELLEGCLAHVQQPAAVPLPASLVPHTTRDRWLFTSPRKGVIAMLGAFGFTLLGMVLWQASKSPEQALPGSNDGSTPPAQRADSQPQTTNTMPKRIHHFPTSAKVKTIACSPDGKLIAVANGNPTFVLLTNGKSRVVDNWQPSAEVLDAAMGKTIVSVKLTTNEEDTLLAASERVPPFEVEALAFSPDGKVLAVGTNAGQVKLFNAHTGELVRSLDDAAAKRADQKTPEKLKALPRAMGSVASLAFSPDGSWLAMCGGSMGDSPLIVDRIERTTLRVNGPGRLKVWEVQTGTLKQDLVGHSHAGAVAFSADGSLLASAGRWDTGAEHGTGVLIWDAQTGKKLRTIATRANGGTHAVVFSPNGKRLAFGSLSFDKENDTRATAVSLTYALSGITEWQETILGWAMPKAFLPDGKSVVVLCRGRTIQFLDTEKGTMNHEIRAADSHRGARWNDLAITSQGHLLAIGGSDAEKRGFVEVWALDGAATGRLESPPKK